jgi:hypothetical protein
VPGSRCRRPKTVGYKFTLMTAAFGTSSSALRVPPERLVEHWPRIDACALATSPSIRLLAGDETSVTLEIQGQRYEVGFERNSAKRIYYFRCSECGSRRRVLRLVLGKLTCRLCANLEYACRSSMRFRGGLSVGRIRRLRAELAKHQRRSRGYWVLVAQLRAEERALAASVAQVAEELRNRHERTYKLR